MSIAYAADMPYVNPLLYSTWDMQQDVDTFNTSLVFAAPWRQATQRYALHAVQYAQSIAHSHHLLAPFGDLAGQFNQPMSLPLQQLNAAGFASRLPWGDFEQRFGSVCTAPWRVFTPHGLASALPFGEYQLHEADMRSLPSGAAATHEALTAMPWSTFAAHALANSLLWRRIVERGGMVAMPWSPIAARSARTVIDWVVEPELGDGTITIPNFPVYVMFPTLSVVRLPDRTPLPVLSASITGELGSWAWTFTAPMARSGLSLIDDGTGTPTEIEIAINGHVWTFMVDGFDDNRRFNSNTCTLRGRSRSAGLAEPHATLRSYIEEEARNASQLADQELTGSGWTLVWDAVDWLVPGGSFSYQDLAPIDAIAKVANSIGAALVSHPEDKELHVVASYPESPWGWPAATPYAVVPAAILTEGSSSWIGGVNADGVYVYAQNNASGALVKITGTDGAAQLPMVVDPLTLHADAQRERGRAELAANGIKRRAQRTVPLFPPPVGEEDVALGVVPLGALLELEEDETWRGQVMGIRIDAQRNGRALSVRQHLTIERQYR